MPISAIHRSISVPEEAEAGPFFSEAELARAHLIRQLKDDLGANDEGIDVILHLVDQVHGLRRVLSELREQIKGGDEQDGACRDAGEVRDERSSGSPPGAGGNIDALVLRALFASPSRKACSARAMSMRCCSTWRSG